MAKMIRIEKCVECPFYSHSYGKCEEKENVYLEDTEQDVHPDCPLEDAPEVKE